MHAPFRRIADGRVRSGPFDEVRGAAEPPALGPAADADGADRLRRRPGDHRRQRRARRAGGHRGARVPRQPLDGSALLRRRRRRDDDRAAAGRAAAIVTELGMLDGRARRDRGGAARRAVPASSCSTSQARGYVCENYGAPFRLPELGPIGSQRPGQSARLPRAGRRVRGPRGAVRGGRASSGRAVGGAMRRTRRSTWSPGTATTRRTSTTSRASWRSAR